MSPVLPCEPDNLDHPAFRAALARDPALVKFLRWSILPQVAVKREKCAARVIVGDARYGSGASSRLSHETLLPMSGPGCPQPDRGPRRYTFTI
jgi:hypothetical protein